MNESPMFIFLESRQESIIKKMMGMFALSLILGSAVQADKKNVLMILVDYLKPSFGAYGAGFVHSPNLDRLAGRGMRFDWAYCNQAVCAPSRNNLMTGLRSTTLEMPCSCIPMGLTKR